MKIFVLVALALVVSASAQAPMGGELEFLVPPQEPEAPAPDQMQAAEPEVAQPQHAQGAAGLLAWLMNHRRTAANDANFNGDSSSEGPTVVMVPMAPPTEQDVAEGDDENAPRSMLSHIFSRVFEHIRQQRQQHELEAPEEPENTVEEAPVFGGQSSHFNLPDFLKRMRQGRQQRPGPMLTPLPAGLMDEPKAGLFNPSQVFRGETAIAELSMTPSAPATTDPDTETETHPSLHFGVHIKTSASAPPPPPAAAPRAPPTFEGDTPPPAVPVRVHHAGDGTLKPVRPHHFSMLQQIIDVCSFDIHAHCEGEFKLDMFHKDAAGEPVTLLTNTMACLQKAIGSQVPAHPVLDGPNSHRYPPSFAGMSCPAVLSTLSIYQCQDEYARMCQKEVEQQSQTPRTQFHAYARCMARHVLRAKRDETTPVCRAIIQSMENQIEKHRGGHHGYHGGGGVRIIIHRADHLPVHGGATHAPTTFTKQAPPAHHPTFWREPAPVPKSSHSHHHGYHNWYTHHHHRNVWYSALFLLSFMSICMCVHRRRATARRASRVSEQRKRELAASVAELEASQAWEQPCVEEGAAASAPRMVMTADGQMYPYAQYSNGAMVTPQQYERQQQSMYPSLAAFHVPTYEPVGV